MSFEFQFLICIWDMKTSRSIYHESVTDLWFQDECTVFQWCISKNAVLCTFDGAGFVSRSHYENTGPVWQLKICNLPSSLRLQKR